MFMICVAVRPLSELSSHLASCRSYFARWHHLTLPVSHVICSGKDCKARLKSAPCVRRVLRLAPPPVCSPSTSACMTTLWQLSVLGLHAWLTPSSAWAGGWSRGKWDGQRRAVHG